MSRSLLVFLLIFFMFVAPVNADTWVSNSSIKSGLGDHGSDSKPVFFYHGGSFKSISGWGPGFFQGYNWTGSVWSYDSDITSGLPDVGTCSSPSVFLDGSTLKLISGEHDGVLNGFYWSGDTWISDSNIVNGTSSVGEKSTPCVFYHDSTFKMIVGEEDGVFNGYYWGGLSWVSDSEIISGLPDVGSRSAPCIFYDSGTLKLISGEFSGVFNGFYWSGDTWISDSEIISGLPDVGSDSSPYVFLDGDTLKLISGEEHGLFYGFTPTPPPPPPQITTIQTRITKETFPLTGIVINDVNSTGGFPNINGYVTLTPTDNSEKIYPISLTGNDLIDGFEFQITATGSEVTATPITVNDLGSDRTYNIYLDGQFLESIGEVTSYQYNITSFSTHTLKVEYDYYVPPGDEDGGGSGPVTHTDEDILPPDEDEIIIEEDVITIGELTITKEEFQLLTIEQIEKLDVSDEAKDKLIAMKSINVNWWLFILVISLTGLIVEGSHKKGHESIIIISFIGVVISAYKLGYF